MTESPSILDQIVATKHQEIAVARSRVPLRDLETLAATAPAVRDFAASLRSASGVGLIAEVKKASPSAGVIRDDFDPVAIAKTYAEHGADCLSVLTDEPYFQGSLKFLPKVRGAVEVPVLRKDFIVDPYQVVEARAAGADCVLLIAECLPGEALGELYSCIRAAGMQALVELYDEDNLDRVLALGGELVGINNRDLRTFHTDLEHTFRLARRIPDNVLVVSESGIRTAADVARLRDEGIGAMLVGESLMRQHDIGRAVDELLVGRE